jgi:hypothetical protein
LSSWKIVQEVECHRIATDTSSWFPSLSGGGGVGRDGDDDDRGLRSWDEGTASGEVHGVVLLGGKRRRGGGGGGNRGNGCATLTCPITGSDIGGGNVPCYVIVSSKVVADVECDVGGGEERMVDDDRAMTISIILVRTC